MSRLLKAEETLSNAMNVNLVDAAIKTMTREGGVADIIRLAARKGALSVDIIADEIGWFEREREVSKTILRYLGYCVTQNGKDKYNISWSKDTFGPKKVEEIPLTDNELDIKLGLKSEK